jgi:hypothetical protein
VKDFESKKVACEKVIDEENNRLDNISSSKDFLEGINKDKFNKHNIDYEDLKNRLNRVYDNPKLIINTINHIKNTHGSLIEVQWETDGMKTKIGVKTKGGVDGVNLSRFLVSRGLNNNKTLQVLHNHTSGIPLPHPQDMINMVNYKINTSGIGGNYGYLNMTNSFKKLNQSNILNIKTKANNLFNSLEKKLLKITII